MSTLESVLEEARARLDKGWWDGTQAANRAGVCIVTSVWHSHLRDRAFDALASVLPPALRSSAVLQDLIAFNDSHAKADVLALYDRAIEACRLEAA